MTNSAAHSQPPRQDDPNAETPVEEQVALLREAMTKMLRAGDGDGVIDALLEIITQQHHDNRRLSKHVDVLTRLLFGRRSEKLTPEELGQLALAFGATPEQASQPEPQVPQPDEPEEEGSDEPEPKPEGEKKPRKGSKKDRHPGRSRLDPKLPRRVTLHFVPADERNCIHCHSEMQPCGHVDHERVQYEPARIEVQIDRCEKVACMTCRQDIAVAARPGAKPARKAAQDSASTEAAPRGDDTEQGDEDVTPAATAAEHTTPASASEDAAKSGPRHGAVAPGAHVYRRAGASLLAHLLEAKADDALPIYRQRQQFARLGFDVPLNTLYGYWDAAARMIQPVADIVLSEILGHDIVALDDTRLDWLDPKADRKRRRGHLWCFMGTSPLVAFQFTETWCADDVAPWIECMDAFIQCDDYKGYGAMRKRSDGSKGPLVPHECRLGCWMHTRRPFYLAFKAGERHAIIALGHIKELYAIEREARDANLTAEQRLELRQSRSIPIADEFFIWVREQESIVRPSSYLGQAVGYALQQKDFLMRCFEDGRFELDTGRVERQIREPVIGRKNYLFSGSPEAAKRLAGVYTLVCSCQNLGINTRAYLVDIITRLQAGFPLREINRLRPDIWAKEHPSLVVAQQMAQQTAQ